MTILTSLEFPASEVDLNEDYKKAFRKKTVSIFANDKDNEEDHLAGKITYSIFDFAYISLFIDEAIGESQSEEWGESKFFNWVLSHKVQLEDKVCFLDKCILFQELDMNITLVNKENLKLIIEGIREEHNIHLSFVAVDTFYAQPSVQINNVFKKLQWKKLTDEYYYKQ